MVPVLIALMAVEGMQSSVRTAVGYCYFLENAPKESASLLGTLWQVMEAIVLMEPFSGISMPMFTNRNNGNQVKVLYR